MKKIYILAVLSLVIFLNCYTTLEVKKRIDTEPQVYEEENYSNYCDDDYYYADMYLGYHRYYDPFYYNRWWIGYSPYYYYYYNPYDYYDYYPDIVIINNYTYKSRYYSGKRYKSSPKKIITPKYSAKNNFKSVKKVKMSKFFKPVYISKNKRDNAVIGSSPVLIKRKNSYGSSGTIGSNKLIKSNSKKINRKTYKTNKSNNKTVKSKHYYMPKKYVPKRSSNKTKVKPSISYTPKKKVYNYSNTQKKYSTQKTTTSSSSKKTIIKKSK